MTILMVSMPTTSGSPVSPRSTAPSDSARRWQTPGTVLDFPDTEEVTGSNPVRPTGPDLAFWVVAALVAGAKTEEVAGQLQNGHTS